MKTVLVVFLVAAIAACVTGKKKGKELGETRLQPCESLPYGKNTCRYHCRKNEFHNHLGECSSGEICCTNYGLIPPKPPVPGNLPLSDEVHDNGHKPHLPLHIEYSAEPPSKPHLKKSIKHQINVLPPPRPHPSDQSSIEEPLCSDIGGNCRSMCHDDEILVRGYSCEFAYAGCCVRWN